MSKSAIFTKARLSEGVRQSVVLALCCFALSKITPLGDIRPFGIALFAVRFVTPKGMLLPALGVFLGSFGVRQDLLGTGIAVCVLYLCGLWGGERFRRVEVRMACLVIAVFLGGFIPWATGGFVLYDLVVLLFSALSAGFSALAFSKIHFKGKGDFLSRLMVCVLFLMAVSGLMGADFSGVLACLLTLVFGAYTDPERAVLSALAFGVCLGFASGAMADAISVLAVSALVFCLLIPRGRVLGALGFLLSVSVFGLGVLGSPFKTPGVLHALPACGLFCLFPKPLDLRLRLLFSETETGGSQKLHRFLTHRVSETGDAFLRLAEVYRSIVRTSTPKENLAIFDRVRGSVCSGCTLSDVCWNRDVLRTQQQAYALLAKLDETGGVEKTDLTDRLRRRCPHAEEFITALNHAYDLEAQVNRHRRQNAGTCAQVAGQFQTVSRILTDLSEELDSEFVRYPSLEHQLYEQLHKKGRRILGITVLKNRYDRYELTIRRAPCGGGGDCATITRIASRLLGVPLQKDPVSCGKKECVLHLCEQEQFSVLVGSAASVKPGESLCGDHHLVMPLRDGKFLLAISDGMGSGPEASEESGAVIALLGSFLSAGFDKNAALRLINSALLLRGGEEMFATVDMAILDLFSGNAEFVKIGSADSYLKSGKTVEVIPSTSLPVGIIDAPDIEHTRRRLRSGDLLVLASDGVAEAFGGSEGLLDRIKKLKQDKSPKRLARELLDEARQKETPYPDDMTLILAQITA